MVLVREARKAYQRYYTECFWSFDPDFVPGLEDVKWVGEQILRHGRRELWPLGVKLCR